GAGLSRVGGKLCSLGDDGRIGFFAAQKIFSLAGLDRRGPGVGQADTRLSDGAFVVERHLRCHRRSGEVAYLAFDLEISSTAARLRRGNTDFCQNLALLERGLK